MLIKIITEPITRAEALEIGQEFYGEMIKGVIDLEREIIALGGEYHMDANNILLADGSSQPDIWGFNIHPKLESEEWIEYTSLINIRPQAGNRTMVIEDEGLKSKIREIIEKLVK